MYCTPPSDGAAVQQQIQHTTMYCTTPSNGAAVQPQIPDTTMYCTTPSNSEYNIQPCTCTTPSNGAAVQRRIQHTTMYVPYHTVRRCRCPTANTTYNHVLYYTVQRSPLSNSEYNIQPCMYCTTPSDSAAVRQQIQYTTMYCTTPSNGARCPTANTTYSHILYHTVRRPRCPTANTIYNQVLYHTVQRCPLSNSKYNIQQLLYHTVRRCRCPTANAIYTKCYQYYQYYLSIPVTLIDESMREKEKGAQSFPTNLTLMDFAGDEEYYSMHHIFLAHEAVYLLVFSLAEAVQNQNRTLERLLFWLHSVKTHANSEDCAVFLVGTHRDSVTSLQRLEVATFLSKNLYRSTCFSSLLVLNADHTPLFPVENSKPEYYSMHHIFLAHEAVYLLVFSLVEAVRNQNRTLERLLFWLHSVKTHASSEDCAVFLVGTHRDSVTSLQRQDVATFLSKNLYRSTCFSSLLVLNADHTPLFPVENSKPVDEDMICLRDAIWTMTQQANYVRRQLPIRWLKFLEVMKRTEKPIISLDNLRQECSQIGLENEEEFYDVLTTFDQAGDIIYQGNDETLKNYVVLDPQLLVDAMAKITCPQPTHIGMPKYVEHLTLLEKKGIVRSDFIHSAVAQLNIDEPSVLLKLLVAYDMLCPLGEEADCDPGHTTYLVPSRLPEYNPKLHRSLSERHGDDDQIFYIDFETFNPDVVYTRVVARCLALCKVKEKTHTRTHVFRNVGCFNVANRFWFTIEPMRPAPDQNVLKITVTSATGSNPFDLLGMLHDILEAIRRRDFPNMSYTSGVCCPFEAPHSDYTEPERIHVLKLAGSGEMFPNESHPLMFLCCGREHQVARAMSTAVSRRSRPQTQLQYSHIQQLALLLDPPRVLGNDWKGLADHLGYGVTEILNFQRTESPTMALLIDYGTKVDKFEAARKITEGLELLGRLDAVAVMTANVNRGVSHDEDK
uniref:Death domain-containing protein n=1 Tax=Branchiostoma floridae TaxID=7739 RepID=C3YMR9_BRAFL|eukprot:XP_002602398.1 hypothetical protein BRAFLDRAFT_63511 [Branchiostoma floridae]